MYFSIIIPVYNIESYIEQCINSVINQNYKNLEIILVNDGSTDQSSNICDRYAKQDQRIKVVHKSNGGLSSARNAGIEVATGDYIFFLDGDDYWNGNFLCELSDFIEKNSNPDIVFTNSVYNFFPRGKVIKQICGYESNELNELNGEDALEYIFTKMKWNAWSAWRNIYKLGFIKEHSLLFKEGILCEDAEWTPRVILKSSSVALYNKTFYMYRKGRMDSIMNTCSKQKLLDYLYIVKGWIEYSNTMKNIRLANIIRSKFCNDYTRYFIYIYFFDMEFIDEIIKEIESLGILDFITEKKLIKLKRDIERKGYKSTLRRINYKYRVRGYIKQGALKLKLIDR